MGSEAPSSLRSIMQALQLVTNGAVSNALTASLSPLVPQDFNEGNLQWYFVGNLALTFVFLAVYWGIAKIQGPFDSAPQSKVAGDGVERQALSPGARELAVEA